MASLVPGYEYDIFISYRQKDNKGDRWVSEFVDALKTELESTFKEEISVYFDINPHDGLLETHDVDASLKEKLKCLVFIPIISRTYCDPKSFAWEHEFKAFVEESSKDQFGLKIKLPNGNVASRVLPIRIHELDIADIKLCESILGGVLRSVDFIYKSAGVNRPLRASEDHPQDNLNKTYYRDQINKVANAVKEIITAIKKHYHHDDAVSKEVVNAERERSENPKLKILLGFLSVLVLLALGYFFIPKLFKSNEPVDKSIAVLPFKNLSNDSTQLWFCDGFVEDIRNNLQKVKSFTVRSKPSSDQYRDTKKSSKAIGNEINANYLIGGSVGREGDSIKIWVHLSDSKADKQIWSNEYKRPKTQIFSLQSEIARGIASELKAALTPEEIEKIERRPTENHEAYNYYLQGNFYYWKVPDSGDVGPAVELYEKAITLDPGFALAYLGIAQCLLDKYWFYKDHSEDVLRRSKKAIDKAFEIDPDLSAAHITLGYYYYIGYLDYSKALEQFKIVLKDQPKNSLVIFWSAAVNRRAGDWEMAKSDFKKALKLDPGRSEIAEEVGETLDLLRNYTEAEKYYSMSMILQPDWDYPYLFLSHMFLRWDGNTKRAREILENAARNNKPSITDSLIIETNVLIDIYDRNYQEALKDLSHLKYDAVQNQAYFRPKYLYYANIYGLMNKPELEHACYDSARILLEKKIIDFPEDQRLYSSLGIAYAGLGLNDKAINTGEKAVKLLPVTKEAYRGVFPVEDLALIYTMVGEYDKAIEQIKYLLSIPGFLSTKILELDPRWAPLRTHPEYKKIIEKFTVN